MKNAYPSAPDNVYSIPRFLKAISDRSLQELTWVAGQLLYTSEDNWRHGEFYLLGQGQILNFNTGQEQEPVKSGSYVGVLISPDLKDGTVSEVHDLILFTEPMIDKMPQPPKVDILNQWSRFQVAVKDYFKDMGFLEVNTPSLVECPGMEPELIPFETQLNMGHMSKKLYLPTSPELHLKKMLSQGLTEIFEVKECFRNGEISEHHESHFFMLEWYRAFDNLTAIKADVIGLIQHLKEQGFVRNVMGEVKEKTMQQLFQELLGFKLTPETSQEEFLELLKNRMIPVSGDETWDELFHLIFLTFIEPRLLEMGPVIVSKYPASQAALARISEDGWADRFEFYWRGFEIANAFHELNDPIEQKKRFESDQQTRKQKYGVTLPIDQEFLQSLLVGLPPAGGIALGLERLFLACLGKTDLKELRVFSASRWIR